MESGVRPSRFLKHAHRVVSCRRTAFLHNAHEQSEICRRHALFILNTKDPGVSPFRFFLTKGTKLVIHQKVLEV